MAADWLCRTVASRLGGGVVSNNRKARKRRARLAPLAAPASPETEPQLRYAPKRVRPGLVALFPTPLGFRTTAGLSRLLRRRGQVPLSSTARCGRHRRRRRATYRKRRAQRTRLHL